MSFIGRSAPPTRWIWLFTAFIWAVTAVIWASRFASVAEHGYRGYVNDWLVYAAGARSLLAGDLYQEPLVSHVWISIHQFNMPPGSALVAIPSLVGPDAFGGTLFVLLNIIAGAAAAVLTARIVNAQPVWFWSGAAFCLFSLFGWGMPAMHGNNSPLVLLMVAGFVALHIDGRSALAGSLLGIAIATKLWPATFLVVLARERSWPTIAWAAGVAAFIFVGTVVWLGGLAVVPQMASAFMVEVDVGSQLLVGITWLRENVDWWPAWGGYAISLLILLIPARGLTGYGLATLAGMAAIPNLWRHYWSTVIFGVVLVTKGMLDRRQDRAGKRPHPESDGRTVRSPTGATAD